LTELTEAEKEFMLKIVGEEMKDKMKELMKGYDEKQKLSETRYELTQQKLNTLLEKMERLLNYPQKNKITLEKILDMVDPKCKSCGNKKSEHTYDENLPCGGSFK